MDRNILYVVNKSKNVKIDSSKIDLLVSNLDFFSTSNQDVTKIKKLSEKEKILKVFLSESINFCFWPEKNWIVVKDGQEISGSLAMFILFNKAINEKRLILDPKVLINLSYEEFCDFFEADNKPNGLFKERYSNFMEVVKIFYKENDFIYDKILNVNNDQELLNLIVKRFKSFNDVSYYNLKKIGFYKRAILIVRELYKYIPKMRDNLNDLMSLTACADYVLPSIFRDFGILNYSKDIAKMVDNDIQIKHNSKIEIEIRAATIFIVDQIRLKLLKKGINVSSAIIDEVVWFYAKQQKLKSKRHKTITIYY